MTVLVTGANGQLGNELRVLATQYPALSFVFTDLPEGDITNSLNVNELVEKTQPQFVVNCAAYTAVDKAESDLALATLINATAVQNLTNACKQAGAYFIHISTDYVFDGKSCLPYRENDATNPQTVYGRTKLQGENFALEYDKSVVIRTAWLYSPFGNNFVKTMLRLGSEKSSINVVADQVGTPTYANDLARAILQIVHTTQQDASRFVGGLFHFSNEGVCSWYDFAVSIMQAAQLPCAVQAIDTTDYPTPAQRPAYSVLHKGKIKQNYDVSVPHWHTALEQCLSLMKK
ncbi:NAD(P)-dependent oxidoreductase [Bacteroidia bacterium]|nr:NAD(P)-dependent oxidoreductase [Bacteroidia bacterium]